MCVFFKRVFHETVRVLAPVSSDPVGDFDTAVSLPSGGKQARSPPKDEAVLLDVVSLAPACENPRLGGAGAFSL